MNKTNLEKIERRLNYLEAKIERTRNEIDTAMEKPTLDYDVEHTNHLLKILNTIIAKKWGIIECLEMLDLTITYKNDKIKIVNSDFSDIQ